MGCRCTGTCSRRRDAALITVVARRILVTGGSGFIGTNVVAALLARGDAVVNLDAVPPRNPAQQAQFRRTDICDAAALARAIDDFGPDCVIHLAARTDLLGTSLDDYATNIDGTAALLAVVADRPRIERVVFASSMLVCRLGYAPQSPTDYAPSTPYGASKVESERLVRAADPGRQRIILCRPTSIWGPWFAQPYRNFFDAVVGGWYIHPADASTRRSYGFVDNAVMQIFALLAAPQAALGDELYHLADYEPVDIGHWADVIATAAGRKPPRRIPALAADLAALAGDGLHRLGWKQPPMTRFRLANMRTNAVLDTGPMQKLCPVLPVGLFDGVDRTVVWMRETR